MGFSWEHEKKEKVKLNYFFNWKTLFKLTNTWWMKHVTIYGFFTSTMAYLYSKCRLAYPSQFQEPNLWCVIRFRVFRLKWPSILYSFIQSRHICQVVGRWNVVHSHCCLFTVWRCHATRGSRPTRPTQVQLGDRVQWQSQTVRLFVGILSDFMCSNSQRLGSQNRKYDPLVYNSRSYTVVILSRKTKATRLHPPSQTLLNSEKKKETFTSVSRK